MTLFIRNFVNRKWIQRLRRRNLSCYRAFRMGQRSIILALRSHLLTYCTVEVENLPEPEELRRILLAEADFLLPLPTGADSIKKAYRDGQEDALAQVLILSMAYYFYPDRLGQGLSLPSIREGFRERACARFHLPFRQLVIEK